MKKWLLGASVALLLSVMVSTPALGWEVTRTDKTKTLPIAGEVTFDSAFKAASEETITINIDPVDTSVTISNVELVKVTPKPNSTSTLTNCSISPSGTGDHNVDVTLTNPDACRTGKSTFHLWLYLSTGEHVGVNVAFGR